MTTNPIHTNRRDFLKTSILSGAAAIATPWILSGSRGSEITSVADPRRSQVAFTHGKDRAQLAFEGLQSFRKGIAAAIGTKRVIIKPNNVAIDNPLAASHAENLEGILEFLKSIGKANVAIAESAAN